MDGISQPSGFCSIIYSEADVPDRAADQGKEAGTDLTQYLLSSFADFSKTAVLEVSPRQSLGLLQTASAGAGNRGLTMIRKIPTIALLIGALAVTGQASAHGHDGGGWGGPAVFGAVVGAAIVGSAIISRDRPVYVEQPVYVQPQPVYVQQPPPVYYQPQPVYIEQPAYYRPAPVYYGPPRGYYYGPPRGYYGHPRW
jgi:hypothetical protein